MAKAEISWKRAFPTGEKVQVYARHIGNQWKFFMRERRYQQWERYDEPVLEDWLELLHAVQRRVNRRLLRPEEPGRIENAIRTRFPDARIE